MTANDDQNGPRDRSPQEPPILRPPDAGQDLEHGSPRRLLAVLGGGLLLVLLAVLVLLLPLIQDHGIESPPQPAPQTQPAVTPSGTVRPPLGAAAASDEVNDLMSVWLQKQAAAEADKVAVWGGDAYADAVELARECDRLLGEQQLLPAREACQSAISRLDELTATKDTRLTDALLQGTQALADADAQAAKHYFTLALAIDGRHAQALAGLQRATDLPELLRLFEAGRAKERQGDAPGATQDYSAAAAIDPEFTPAREGLARVQAAVADRQFQQAMSRALEGLAGGRYPAAAKALQQARALKPGDPAVRDLQRQLDQAQRGEQLAQLRRQAETFAQQEQWPEALSRCEQALAVDPHAAFAVSCKEQATLRSTLDQRLQGVLSAPQRLFDAGPREEARQLLSQALGLTPRGPRLVAQLDQLAELIRQAEAEVEVVLRSDGLTDIVIYHVGRLGRFQEKRLVLPTGNYTATGSRNGFRDVRRTLEVRPGNGTLVFSLVCEESI